MKKEIYITALHLAHGGVEMAISLMSNAFIKKGYSVTILSLYQLGEPAYPISPRVKIEYLTDVKPNKKEFKEAIKSKNPFRILKEGFYAVKVLRLKKNALVKRIKEILEDDELEDEECFMKIEEIVCVFEDLGMGCGSRHDF